MLKRPYKNKQKPYKDKDTTFWLEWLAKQLIRENKTEFLIEKMQPSWLENREKKRFFMGIYGLFLGLFTGLYIELFYRLIYGLTDKLIHGISGVISGVILMLVLGVTYGLTYGLTSGVERWDETIKTVESFQFSLKNVKNQPKLWLFLGLFSGLCYFFIFWNNFGLIIGLNSGLIIGITFGLIFLLQGPEIDYKKIPNQGIWQSLKSMNILIIITFLAGLGLSLLLISASGKSVGVINILFGSFGFSLLFSVLGCGVPVMLHFSLRLVLWFNHYIPWNYARFLDYSTERLFLQRVGGGYRFIHDLLRQHFASQYNKNNFDSE
ncbi:MAG: hypothetical protein F6K18_28175 [Okeania sp. SIO2C2]|uniref:hypothetical protein n=1 Tax=Okeania sp. SIO2C2 TaxID=2607787 RepID=UPI0013BC09B2|nr:hypothetical protein [Okeania sp. SIO2C2]NEP90391.1 hypothetical protein [Okeania sp. SIO2C2]